MKNLLFRRSTIGKVVELLAMMMACGVFTFLVTVYILMDLGSRYHGNYNHYGQQFDVLTWFPVVIGFLAPGVLAGLFWLWTHRNNRYT